MWVSFNDGATWQTLRRNLPIVPIHDLAVKEGDLVAGTHGRSFWILDDLSALRQMSQSITAKPAHLFKPRDVYRANFSGGGGTGAAEIIRPDRIRRQARSCTTGSSLRARR